MKSFIYLMAIFIVICMFLSISSIYALDFTVTVSSSQIENGVEVRDIQWPVKGTNESATSAYLVRRLAKGSYAGILYFHLLDKLSSREEFLEEAKKLAPYGVVSVLIQGRTPWFTSWEGDAADLALVQSQVQELSRAFGVLMAESGVDPNRVAVVGHDYGAMYCANLISQDPCIKAAVLMAFVPHFGDWIGYFHPKLSPQEYTAALLTADPVTALAKPRSIPVLFQFAGSDIYVDTEAVEAITKAAAQPFEVQWVDGATHTNIQQVGMDARLKWLLPKIGILLPK